jgi:hypothetical protein
MSYPITTASNSSGVSSPDTLLILKIINLTLLLSGKAEEDNNKHLEIVIKNLLPA